MIYVFDQFEFDEERWELRSQTAALDVPPKVMEVIALLLRHRDRVVTVDELLTQLWPRVTVTEASITKTIRIARQVLGDDGDAQRFIKTTRGRGYRFIAAVREIQPSRRTSRPPPSPQPSLPPNEAVFVGRGAELEELRAAFRGAIDGRGSFFLLAGEAGIGKTRLAEAYAAHACTIGGSVHWGRCSEAGGAPELWPWLQVIRGLLESGDCELDELAVLEALVKASSDPPVADGTTSWTPLSTESARFRVFEAIASGLRRAARRTPVLVILEDLQTADASTLMLTRFLARELRDARLVLIGTYRPAEVDRGDATSGLIRKLVQDARTIELGGLSNDELLELAHTVVGAPLDPDLSDRLKRTTDGNPLFATEVLRLIASAPFTTTTPPKGWKMPGRVVEAVRSRFDALSPSTRDVLAIASVIGRDFDVRVLLEVSELRAADLAAELDAAEERRIVAPLPDSLGAYRFSHMLLRDVLYEDLPLARRAALHRHIGEVLEQAATGAEPAAAQLAHHFLRAALGGASEKAAVHSMAAGRHAIRAFAFDEAVQHFEHALDALRFLKGKECMQCDALIGLGQARSLTGNYALARDTFRQAFDAALQFDDPRRAAKAALGYAQVKPESGLRNDEVIALLERVVPLLEAEPHEDNEVGEVLALSLARLAICLPFANRSGEAEALSVRALELARSMKAEILALCLLARHWVTWKPGTARERLAMASEILGLNDSLPNHQTVMEARLCQITDLLELGRADTLSLAISEYERLARSLHDPLGLWNARVFETMRCMLEGRFAEAERVAFETLPEGLRIDEQNARMFFVAQIWWIRLEQGRASEIVQFSREAVESRNSDPLFRTAVLRVYIAEGDRKAVREHLDALAKSGFADLAEGFQLLPMLAHAAAACAFLGDARCASSLYQRLLAYDGTHVVIGPAIVYLGPVSLYLGLCASAASNHDEAVKRFEQALAESRELGARPTQARARYHLAEALLRRTQDADIPLAATAANEALVVARQLGMQELVQRATTLLEHAHAVDASRADR